MYQRLLFLFSLCLLLSGCISTKVNDFTDPEYKQFQAKKILVQVPGREFEQVFVKQASKQRLTTEVITWSSLFLPTRQYTQQQIAQTLQDKQIDAVLHIDLQREHSDAQGGGYVTNNNGFGYSTHSIPTRETQASAKLTLADSQVQVWTAEIQTDAQGAYNVQRDDTMESISLKVLEALLKKHHIRKGYPLPKG